MNFRQLLLLMCFLPTILFGQKDFKFHYQITLKDQQSTYLTQIKDTSLNGKSLINFNVFDFKGERLPSAEIKIQNAQTDTILPFINGTNFILLKSDTYNISIHLLQYVLMKLDSVYFKPDSKTIINITLGESKQGRYGTIYSKRELTKSEIEKIIEDYSKASNDNTLLKDKTCIIYEDL